MFGLPRAAIRGLIFASFFIVNLFANWVWAQETADFFKQNYANCHTIGGGPLKGPDLKDVSQRKDRDWLIEFMVDPQAVIDSGDKYALEMRRKFGFTMTQVPGVAERAEDLLDLIKVESAKETSRFKGLQISDEPFDQDDRDLGHELFIGREPLDNGGAACISCHDMHSMSALGGGRLGPDLTNVYGRHKNRNELSNWLTAPDSKTMKPIYKNNELKPEEIRALVAYFEASAGATPADPTTNRVALLLIGVLVATGIVFGMDAIWKRRFHSVRQPLVDSSPVRGHS